ncbi:hypothetical protein GOV12_03015 [Candidatus Pacearchaeota archaeon]|nr:hypothetical protein [Candidatus Pacearchaeota archaeon]
MATPFIISGFFLDYALPFALIFTLIFAVLQKTKLLGEGRKQIDAIIGLIVGLILVATPFARDIVVNLMPFLAVFATILLVFMLLYGFIVGKNDGDVLGKGWKYVFIGVLAISLVLAIIILSGYWDLFYGFLFEKPGSSTIWLNLLIIAVIVGALVAVLIGKEKSTSS